MATCRPARRIIVRQQKGHFGAAKADLALAPRAPRRSDEHVNRTRTSIIWITVCTLGLCAIAPTYALDLSPRLWNHLPSDINLAGFVYADTEADIFADPTLRLENVEAKLDTWAGKYIRTFAVFDKSARLGVTQGYQEGEWKGLLNAIPTKTKRSGWTDTFVRLAVNLYGAPVLRGKEYATYRAAQDVETIIGAALVVRLPTGKYLEDKLINLGQNRFAFRPQLGFVHRRGKLAFEITGEIAFYTENDEFFEGNVLEQKARCFAHAHLVYTFRPGLWFSASLGYDKGGENEVNGVDKDDQTQNLGWAFALALPINRYVGINFTYIGTRTQESVGFDSDTLSGAIAIAW